jgi:hypothetical protein
MRPATIISILRESHLPFSKNDYNGNRPHTSLNEAHPDGARNPPDEAMTILELLSVRCMAALGGIVLQNYFHDPNEQH